MSVKIQLEHIYADVLIKQYFDQRELVSPYKKRLIKSQLNLLVGRAIAAPINLTNYYICWLKKFTFTCFKGRFIGGKLQRRKVLKNVVMQSIASFVTEVSSFKTFESICCRSKSRSYIFALLNTEFAHLVAILNYISNTMFCY